MTRSFVRSLACSLGVFAAVAGATLPASADMFSGAYSCTTRTGIKIGVVLIQNGGDITGYYIGHNQIAGHITGKLNDQDVLEYKWYQKKDEASNEQDDGGWGRMTFTGNREITGMNAAWGRPENTTPVGFWTCGAPL